jgi:hypothetical protein
MINNDQLFLYLEKKIPQFVKTRKAKSGELLFTCPNGANHKFKSAPSATFSPSGNIVCLICGWKGSLYDAIRVVEPNYTNKTDAEITAHLIEELGLTMYQELDAYQKYGFALIPLLQNSKVPMERGWTETIHKDKVQHIKWLNNNLNIGIRTGEVSGIMVIDFDNKGELSEEKKKIKEELDACNTLIQNTANGGYHYVFKYEKELTQTTNIGGYHIDIRNDGGQIVVAPSKIDIKNYSWKNLGTEIKIIPIELKNKLLTLMKSVPEESIEVPEKNLESLKLKNNNLDGCCNDTFVSIGGMLVKQLSPQQTEFVLNIMNKHLLESPMPANMIKSMIGSLADYKGDDESTYEKTIYEYMKLMQTDVTPRDIIDNTKLPRAIVDKYLSQFVKEGKAVRLGRGRYQYKERIEWSDAAPETLAEYKYKIPFFNDIAIFQDKDVLLLGARTNDGKTTVAMNMLAEMAKQGVKPYYIYSEAGSRFQKTSQILGITGKYFHTYHENPLAIELEYNAFSIIDWLHLEHKENTDTILKHLNDELQRKGGILVIFTQLKQTSEFFAPNLIDHYPTFAARLIQDNNEKTESHWDINKIKEPRGNFVTYILPCEYNHETRVFKKKDLT